MSQTKSLSVRSCSFLVAFVVTADATAAPREVHLNVWLHATFRSMCCTSAMDVNVGPLDRLGRVLSPAFRLSRRHLKLSQQLSSL